MNQPTDSVIMSEPGSTFQQYFAGLDGNGRSAIIGVGASAQSRAGGALTVRNIWTMSAQDRTLTPGRAIELPAMDVGVEVGASRALISSFRQGHDSGMHRTETVDLSIVLAGPVDFHVETVIVTLNTGDCVMVPGVLHRWHAKDADCTLAVIMVGSQSVD